MRTIQFKHKITIHVSVIVALTIIFSTMIVSFTVNRRNKDASLESLKKSFMVIQRELKDLQDKTLADARQIIISIRLQGPGEVRRSMERPSPLTKRL